MGCYFRLTFGFEIVLLTFIVWYCTPDVATGVETSLFLTAAGVSGSTHEAMACS